MANPKKSKAFIITFIAVILLLLIGYWLFSNKDRIFGVGEINIGKIFEPLLGTSDRVGLNVITNPSGGTSLSTTRVIVPVEAGEVIPSNSLVYAVGANQKGNPIVLVYDEVRDGSKGVNPFGITINNIKNKNIGNAVIVNKIIAEGGENINLNGLVYTTGTNENGQPIIFNYDETRDKPKGIVPFGFAIEAINNGELGNIIFVNNKILVEGGENITGGGLIYSIGANVNGYPIVLNYNKNTDGASGTIPLGTAVRNINFGSLGEAIIIDYSKSNGNLWDKTTNFFGGVVDSIFGNNNNNNNNSNSNSNNNNNSTNNITGNTNNTACSDGTDNDNDGLIDINDPECHTDGNPSNPNTYAPTHYAEDVIIGTRECSDGIDNDGKGDIDEADPDCHIDGDLNKEWVKNHYSESFMPGYNPECSNNKDDDSDGGVDILDPECHTDGDINNQSSYVPTHDSENVSTTTYIRECNDGIDNDGDGFIDIQDSGCYSNGDISIASDYNPYDNSELSGIATPGDNNGNGNTGNTIKTECEDTIDNDGDNLIDASDPGCHTDKDASNYSTYDSNLDNEAVNNQKNVEVNYCTVLDQYPLEFTDEEKSELDSLLRQFYLIAPTLKTEDDILVVYNEVNRYKNFIIQLNNLTGRCYLETNNLSAYDSFCSRNPSVCENIGETLNTSYITPKIYGNPWYKSYDRGGSYLSPNTEVDKSSIVQIGESDGFDWGHARSIVEKDFELLLNIW